MYELLVLSLITIWLTAMLVWAIIFKHRLETLEEGIGFRQGKEIFDVQGDKDEGTRFEASNNEVGD